MGRISNHRRKLKEVGLKVQQAKSEKKSYSTPEKEGQNDLASKEIIMIKASKCGRKKKCLKNTVTTRHQAVANEEREKNKREICERTQKGRDKAAEARENAKAVTNKRRINCNETHIKVKQRRQEEIIQQQQETINKLQETIDSALLPSSFDPEPSTSLYQPLSINIDNSSSLQSELNSPTDIMTFKHQMPLISPPTPKVNADASTRIKSRVSLSHGQYSTLREELAIEGIDLPSQSTVRRYENRIFNDHFKYSDKPDFYGLVEKAVLKITIGGDGGGDGDKSSVKVGCFFNDIPLPLSVKKFLIIWSYVGKESWEMLKAVLPHIDADVLRLQKNGIRTKEGVKSVIITYVGDCKFLCTSLSLQGGYSVCGCPKCITKRIEWPTIKSEDIVLRTIESIIIHAENVLNKNGKNQMNGSVFNHPLLRNIPITHFVPPPVHLLISLVKRIIEYIFKKKGENFLPLEEFLKNSGAKRDPRTKSYNGNGCRKIMSHFREENEKRIIYGDYGNDLFLAASNIERYAVARTLHDDEIKALEAYINLFFNLLKEEYGQEAMKFFLNKTLVHMLKEHVVPFVKIFKSWGLFSEESVESIHHIRNELDNRIPGAGPEIDAKRTSFFYKNQTIALHYT